MHLGDPQTQQELITLVCGSNLKQIPVYKFQEHTTLMMLDLSLSGQLSTILAIKKT
jgi:hypothetical protein